MNIFSQIDLQTKVMSQNQCSLSGLSLVTWHDYSLFSCLSLGNDYATICFPMIHYWNANWHNKGKPLNSSKLNSKLRNNTGR